MKFCEKCGNELMDEAVICPKCGCSVAKPTPVAAGEPMSKKAKTAAILGVLSLLVFAPLGIPSIILAVSSKKETGGVMNKHAKTGLGFSLISIILWAIVIVVYCSQL